MKNSRGISELEYFLHGVFDMKISVSLPSQKTRGTKKDAAGACCSTRVEAKTWRMQRAFCDAATKEKPGCKDLEKEVNKRQDATAKREKERNGLLEPMERKEKLRIGAPKGM